MVLHEHTHTHMHTQTHTHTHTHTYTQRGNKNVRMSRIEKMVLHAHTINSLTHIPPYIHTQSHSNKPIHKVDLGC